MKKFLLALLLGYSVSALAQTEPQPYYFSDELKNAIKNCTPYSEDLYEKNPDMKEQASSTMGMFFDRLDLSKAKMILNIRGPQEDKCQISVKYDYQFPMIQEYECTLPQEAQDKLINAMNDRSTETKTRKIGSNGFSMTMTAREFDLTFSEITSSFCKVVEHEPTEEELAEMKRKEKEMMAFSDKFKNSLKRCSPDRDTIKVMGMDVNEVEIKGKEKGRCHIVSHGFHILLNDNELNLSGFDELTELFSDEKRTTYQPFYKYAGIRYSLDDCKNPDNGTTTYGSEKISFGNIQVQQKVQSSYEKNICHILVGLVVRRNGKNENYSIRCEIPEAKINRYIDFEKSLENDDLEADKKIFSKMYKDGICKKMADLPPENSEGCPDSKPLKEWGLGNECYSCDELERIKLKNSNDCERVCNGLHGRAMRVEESFDCVLETCPASAPLRDAFGSCYSCDYDDSVTTDEGCSVCKNRKVEDGSCIIADCTNRPLIDADGKCYPCTTENEVAVEKGKCTSICPNRVESGSWSDGDKSGVFCGLKF